MERAQECELDPTEYEQHQAICCYKYDIALWVSIHVCGLMVRVPGYRTRRAVFDSRRYQIFLVVGTEWGPLCLVRITEALLELKVLAPVQRIEITSCEDQLH
jgi:hypothetical protein